MMGLEEKEMSLKEKKGLVDSLRRSTVEREEENEEKGFKKDKVELRRQ